MSEPSAPKLQDLVALARDRSRQGRGRLFQVLADLFIGENAKLTERERMLLTGIVDMLIGMVDRDLRRGVADRIGADDDGPAELAHLLARDVIEVARPILRASPHLQDADLVGIIRNLGRDHAEAIAFRSALSEIVTDALLGTGDPDVIVAVLESVDARLSAAGHAYLAAEAQRVRAYQRPLLQRGDLPSGTALRLFWWVPTPLRRYILEHADPDPEEGQAAPPAPADGLVSRAVQEAADAVIAPMVQSGQLTSRALMDFVRGGRVPPFIAGLARYCDLPLAVSQRVCLDGDGEPLAVVCRSIDLNRNDFASLFLLLRKAARGREPLPPKAVNEILTFYDRLPRDRMAAITRYWSRNPDQVTALDTVPSIARPPA